MIFKAHRICVFLFLAGLCSCQEKDPEPLGPETQVPRLKGITSLTDSIVIAPQQAAAVLFEVEDKEAVFNYAAQTVDCQIELRLDGTTKAPTHYAIIRIEPASEKGQWNAYLQDTGLEAFYEERVRLCLITARSGNSRTLVTSNVIAVSSARSHSAFKNIRFTKAVNPQLSSDFSLGNPTGTGDTLLYQGHTPCYLSSMQLIASFDCNASVTVNGQSQQSGVSVQDFSQPVTYQVNETGSSPVYYQVHLHHFTGVPVIQITTNGGQEIKSKDDWVAGTFRLDGMDQFEDIPEMEMEIKGRGNTTWEWPKKPYAIKLSSKQPLFGFPAHKRWVLLANFMDRTLMRNFMAFSAGALTALDWTPRCQFAEVILNGKHLGNYLITEQIKEDGHRVDLEKDGGWLLELDFHYDNPVQWVSNWGTSAYTGGGIPFAVKYPEDDVITQAQIDAIKAHIDTVGRVLYSANFLDPKLGYASYIDLQSFVDYWLIFELCINHELANPGSVYMWKNKNTKWHAGPLWDFDWGTFSYQASPQAKGNLFMTQAIWYAQLTKDPAFKTLAKQRWEALKPAFNTLPALLRQTSERLATSASYNFAMWDPTEDKSMNGGQLINGDETLTYNAAVDRMYDILVERLETLDREINNW